MKKFILPFIFTILMLSGGCKKTEINLFVDNEQILEEMQDTYRIISLTDGDTYILKLINDDGEVKIARVPKESVSSVKEEDGYVILEYKNGSKVSFLHVAVIDVTLSEKEISMTKRDSATVTFSIKTDEPDKVKIEVLQTKKVNATAQLNEGNTGGTISFSLKGLESFKEDVVIRFDNGLYKTDEIISVSRLNFGFANGSDSITYYISGDDEKVRIDLLGEIEYTACIENGCDWASISETNNNYLEMAFEPHYGAKRTTKALLTDKDNETIELTIVQRMSQRAILTKLYETLNGKNWINQKNWCTDKDLKEWEQVVTDDNGHVIKLFLDGINLEGSLPDELFELWSLEELRLNSPAHENTLDNEDKDFWNNISGNLNELGPKIAKLTNLKVLDLGGLINITCGDIPDEIWMPQLERLNLQQLPIKGRITAAIGNATNLTYLDISRNNRKTDLRGTIPNEITKLKKLEELWLSSNDHLTGPIPENIGDMESLSWFDLTDCALTGTIPESLIKLKNLYAFQIDNNFIKGEFDLSKLTNFPNMRYFVIDTNNSLQGIGEVPDFIERVSFDRDGYTYNYEYGKLRDNGSWPSYNWQRTDEKLAERLAEP